MHCSGNVYVWDTEARLLKQVAASGFKPRAAAFSSGPVNDDGAYHVAIGGTKGEIKVPTRLRMRAYVNFAVPSIACVNVWVVVLCVCVWVWVGVGG